jgi:hypothetical protein
MIQVKSGANRGSGANRAGAPPPVSAGSKPDLKLIN